MKPSLGRIVLFRPTTPSYEGQLYPACIVKVWSDDVVNLEVFGDIKHAEEPQGKFPTSVAYDGDALTEEPRRWFWPPKV